MSLGFGEASTFVSTWTGLLDTNAPVEAFLKYLPDGDFEEWSYPTAEIANVEELLAYFQATFGAFTSNSNELSRQVVTRLDDGRFEIVADAIWTGVTGGGETIVSPIQYTLTIGSGSSSHDPGGVVPKVYRYRIRPIS